MPKDYGYFGKGFEGYSHYMLAFSESQKGRRGKKPPSGGCFTAVVQAAAALLIAAFVISAWL